MFHDTYIFLFMVAILTCIVWSVNINHISTNVNFAKTKTSRPRILAGEEVSHSKYRFVVAIMRRDNATSEEYEYCTGAVVKENIILTACHCVGDVSGVQVKLFDPRLLSVVAGTGRIYEDSPQRQVSKVRSFQAHWNCKVYEPGTIIETDAALIILKDSLDFGEDVQPMGMVENEPKALQLRLNNQVRMETICTLPGYGFSEPDTPTSVLNEAQLQLISDYECRKIFCEKAPTSPYCNYNYDEKNLFCAIPIDNADGSTPCKGDSGAPLVCDGYIYGLLTWGGCRPEYPVVMAKGSSALQLIKMHAKPNYGEARRSSSSVVQTTEKAQPYLILIPIMYTMLVLNMNLID